MRWKWVWVPCGFERGAELSRRGLRGWAELGSAAAPGGCWWVPGTCQAQCALDISPNSPNGAMRPGLVFFPILRVGKPRLSELR